MAEVLSVVFLVLLVWGTVVAHVKRERSYTRWPTLDEYRQRFPEFFSFHGPRCMHCGSPRLAQRGWRSPGDARRLHFCTACGTVLYRTDGLVDRYGH